MTVFFPYPYPVSTPLGEGYAIYVTPAPMFENDQWCVQLDDGRILHFSTNQLRGVPNGTYEIQPPKPTPAARELERPQLRPQLRECLDLRSHPTPPETPGSRLAAATRRAAAKVRGPG